MSDNTLYYGENLEILCGYIDDESVSTARDHDRVAALKGMYDLLGGSHTLANKYKLLS